VTEDAACTGRDHARRAGFRLSAEKKKNEKKKKKIKKI
jgi:hypothetical protein